MKTKKCQIVWLLNLVSHLSYPDVKEARLTAFRHLVDVELRSDYISHATDPKEYGDLCRWHSVCCIPH